MYRLLAALGILAVLIAGVIAVLLDVGAPRSSKARSALLSTNYAMSLQPYNERRAADAAQYGPSAHTTFDAGTGVIETIVDGKVVAHSTTLRRFTEARGILYAHPHKGEFSVFPFKIGPTSLPKDSEFEDVVSTLKERYRGKVPARYLAFGRDDVSIGHCASYAPAELGLSRLATVLRLGAAGLCIADFRGRPAARMLIGVTTADAGRWLRPFTERLCFTLAERWLGTTEPGGAPLPDYAACIIADRPYASETAEIVIEHIFEIRADKSLAVMH
jgi:hypothetical protein